MKNHIPFFWSRIGRQRCYFMRLSKDLRSIPCCFHLSSNRWFTNWHKKFRRTFSVYVLFGCDLWERAIFWHVWIWNTNGFFMLVIFLFKTFDVTWCVTVAVQSLDFENDVLCLAWHGSSMGGRDAVQFGDTICGTIFGYVHKSFWFNHDMFLITVFIFNDIILEFHVFGAQSVRIHAVLALTIQNYVFYGMGCKIYGIDYTIL